MTSELNTAEAGEHALTVWKFEVIDLHALYKEQPELVTLEPKSRAIEAAVLAGMRECPGLRIWQETKAVVRL